MISVHFLDVGWQKKVLTRCRFPRTQLMVFHYCGLEQRKYGESFRSLDLNLKPQPPISSRGMFGHYHVFSSGQVGVGEESGDIKSSILMFLTLGNMLPRS